MRRGEGGLTPPTPDEVDPDFQRRFQDAEKLTNQEADRRIKEAQKEIEKAERTITDIERERGGSRKSPEEDVSWRDHYNPSDGAVGASDKGIGDFERHNSPDIQNLDLVVNNNRISLKDGSETIGYVRYAVLEDGAIDVEFIFVDDKHRKKGYGTELLKAIERMAEGQEVRIKRPFSDMVPYYKKRGYNSDPDGTDTLVKKNRNTGSHSNTDHDVTDGYTSGKIVHSSDSPRSTFTITGSNTYKDSSGTEYWKNVNIVDQIVSEGCNHVSIPGDISDDLVQELLNKGFVRTEDGSFVLDQESDSSGEAGYDPIFWGLKSSRPYNFRGQAGTRYNLLSCQFGGDDVLVSAMFAPSGSFYCEDLIFGNWQERWQGIKGLFDLDRFGGNLFADLVVQAGEHRISFVKGGIGLFQPDPFLENLRNNSVVSLEPNIPIKLELQAGFVNVLFTGAKVLLVFDNGTNQITGTENAKTEMVLHNMMGYQMLFSVQNLPNNRKLGGMLATDIRGSLKPKGNVDFPPGFQEADFIL